MERELGHFTISDAPDKVDHDRVFALLKDTYWAGDRSKEQVMKSIENSICISVYAGTRQIGFARVVTDKAVFAWIADIIVEEPYRRRGIGKEIMKFIQDHPDIPKSRQLLRTKDAHALYEQFGFKKDGCMTK